MRALLIVSLLIPAAARADRIYTPLIDPNTLDPSCRELAMVPRHVVGDGQSYDAAISTANCMVMVRTRPLRLQPTDDSVAELEAAVAPAIAILDRVIVTGDAKHQLIAAYAKADIFEGNTARMLGALPKLSPQMEAGEVADRDAEVRAVDRLTAAWRHDALQCRRQVARIAGRDPALVRDPVVARMVADSRILDATGLAAR